MVLHFSKLFPVIAPDQFDHHRDQLTSSGGLCASEHLTKDHHDGDLGYDHHNADGDASEF